MAWPLPFTCRLTIACHLVRYCAYSTSEADVFALASSLARDTMKQDRLGLSRQHGGFDARASGPAWGLQLGVPGLSAGLHGSVPVLSILL
jgi:hypothetical protein